MNRKIKKLITITLAAGMLMTHITTFMVSAENMKSNIPNEIVTPFESYTGGEITPVVNLSDSGTVLVNGIDYDLSYRDNIEAGTATVIITFKRNYEGSRTANFTIVARSLSDNDVVFEDIQEQIYTGSEITPEPTITYGDVTLVKEKDYTLSYENNIEVGVGKINVTFIGNYEGTASTEFDIAAKELNSESVSFSEVNKQTYTGTEIIPDVSITYGEVILEKDKDYTISYENNINVGTANINVTFIGNYIGMATDVFEITAKMVTDENITISTIPDQTYTGKELKPEPVITDISR